MWCVLKPLSGAFFQCPYSELKTVIVFDIFQQFHFYPKKTYLFSFLKHFALEPCTHLPKLVNCYLESKLASLFKVSSAYCIISTT